MRKGLGVTRLLSNRKRYGDINIELDGSQRGALDVCGTQCSGSIGYGNNNKKDETGSTQSAVVAGHAEWQN